MASQALLSALGDRVRETRLGARLTVSELARRAGMSRRYLTETEAGRANPSLLTLVQIAGALGVALPELVDLPTVRRGERIALVGLRGAGKSTVGRLLALELESPFVELDERVEALAGLTLSELFDLHGEEAYRRYEAEALENVLAEGERLVLATGGSIVTSPATFTRLRQTCRTVWLQARPEEHFQRVLSQGDRRPMANRPRAMAELEAILAEREGEYGRCDLDLVTSGRTPERVAEEIQLALAEPART